MKRGQIKLSFGMIFSIILIIIFLAVVFYVISSILNLSQKAQIGIFIDDFQQDINNAWKQEKTLEGKTYSIGKEIQAICFTEDSEIYFQPYGTAGDLDYQMIEHLYIDDEFCIDTKDNKIKIRINKEFGDNLVRIE